MSSDNLWRGPRGLQCGKKCHHQTQGAVCQCHRVDSQARNLLSSGVDTFSLGSAVCPPNAKDVTVRQSYRPKCALWGFILVLWWAGKLSRLFIYTLPLHPKLPGMLFLCSSILWPWIWRTEWMLSDKTEVSRNKKNISSAAVFKRHIFSLYCKINCRCPFCKVNREWTSKHVLDKKLLIYHITHRRQVWHWILKEVLLFYSWRCVSLHTNLHSWQFKKIVLESFHYVSQALIYIGWIFSLKEHFELLAVFLWD